VTVLTSFASRCSRTVVRHATAAAAKLADDAVLITVPAADAAAAVNDFDALRAIVATGAAGDA
jgi:hypothetical protein